MTCVLLWIICSLTIMVVRAYKREWEHLSWYEWLDALLQVALGPLLLIAWWWKERDR